MLVLQSRTDSKLFVGRCRDHSLLPSIDGHTEFSVTAREWASLDREPIAVIRIFAYFGVMCRHWPTSSPTCNRAERQVSNKLPAVQTPLFLVAATAVDGRLHPVTTGSNLAPEPNVGNSASNLRGPLSAACPKRKLKDWVSCRST